MLEGVAIWNGRCGPSGPRAHPSTPSNEGRRSLLARLSAMSLVGLGRPLAPDPEAEEEATAVARAWLDLLDEGRYTVSRSAATDEMRDAIGEGDWLTALRTTRAPLGRCHSRSLRCRDLLALPGETGGRWAVIRFRTGFERKSEVTETVAALQEADGRWRVAAYFVG